MLPAQTDLSIMIEILKTVLIFVVATIFFESAHCLFVNIDANAEECFFDKVTSGTKMSLMFEVAEGGFLDIDIKVPECHQLFKGFTLHKKP